ncbi:MULTISPECIES: VrrA/YqfQ family protein [Bacillus]|uniref:YqfQ-like protein n=2 Tax=Bacillus TaxID=1386 RepID=A0A0M4G1J6_9BACI|nr:hypothetical protein AM592_08560 [Bacillus gobiensis]
MGRPRMPRALRQQQAANFQMNRFQQPQPPIQQPFQQMGQFFPQPPGAGAGNDAGAGGIRGLLSKFLPGAGGLPGAGTGSGLQSLQGLQNLANPANISGMLGNVQKMLGMAQQITPMVQQYGPLVRNIPSMIKLYSQLNKADDANSKEDKSSAENSNETMQASSQQKKKKKTAADSGQPASKPSSNQPSGSSRPRLYV